jgi:hypothetical protein
LGRLAPVVKDWRRIDGLPTLLGPTSYRICLNIRGEVTHVEKRASSTWRKDNRFTAKSLGELVADIETKSAG